MMRGMSVFFCGRVLLATVPRPHPKTHHHTNQPKWQVARWRRQIQCWGWLCTLVVDRAVFCTSCFCVFLICLLHTARCAIFAVADLFSELKVESCVCLAMPLDPQHRSDQTAVHSVHTATQLQESTTCSSSKQGKGWVCSATRLGGAKHRLLQGGLDCTTPSTVSRAVNIIAKPPPPLLPAAPAPAPAPPQPSLLLITSTSIRFSGANPNPSPLALTNASLHDHTCWKAACIHQCIYHPTDRNSNTNLSNPFLARPDVRRQSRIKHQREREPPCQHQPDLPVPPVRPPVRPLLPLQRDHDAARPPSVAVLV